MRVPRVSGHREAGPKVTSRVSFVSSVIVRVVRTRGSYNKRFATCDLLVIAHPSGLIASTAFGAALDCTLSSWAFLQRSNQQLFQASTEHSALSTRKFLGSSSASMFRQIISSWTSLTVICNGSSQSFMARHR